jgi:TonB dependent receptor
VADPNLQQVITYTVEAGLRGQFNVAQGLVNWTAGGFRALNTNDIIAVSSPIPGHQFFQNAGNTLRQGIEANVTHKQDRWTLYANYTYVDATLQNALTLQSPFNPFADANGNIFVVPSDHLTGIPNFRFKLGGEYQVTKPWKVGADLNVVGSQWLVGDESNQNSKVPAYWVVNLHSSYKITDNVEVFGLVRNLFDQHCYVFGTFFDVTSFPYLGQTDPRTFVPGMPLAGYLGIRGTLPTIGPAFAADAAPPVVTKAAPVADVAAHGVNWTGIHLGLNGGFTFGGSRWADSVTCCSTGNFDTSGFVFGGTLGADYQLGRIVLGVEADGDWADASGSATFMASALCAGGCRTTSTWAQHRARPRRLCFRPFPGLQHRRRRFRRRPGELHQQSDQRRDRGRMDCRRRRRGGAGAKLERQGGIFVRQARRRIMHRGLRNRRRQRPIRHSERRRQSQ